jgi:hypothetical protein
MNKREQSNPFKFILVLTLVIAAALLETYNQNLFASPNFNDADFVSLPANAPPMDIRPKVGCPAACWKIAPKSTNNFPLLIPLRCEGYQSFMDSIDTLTPLIVSSYKPYHVVDSAGKPILDALTKEPVIFKNPVPRASSFATKSACTTTGCNGGGSCVTAPPVLPETPCDPSDPAGSCYLEQFPPQQQYDGCNGGACSGLS